ncbi:hypothetical protein AAEP93_011203 [Penicillium crustosum]
MLVVKRLSCALLKATLRCSQLPQYNEGLRAIKGCRRYSRLQKILTLYFAGTIKLGILEVKTNSTPTTHLTKNIRRDRQDRPGVLDGAGSDPFRASTGLQWNRSTVAFNS